MIALFRHPYHIVLALLLLGSPARGADFKTPIVYTASLMAVEFAALHALNMQESSVSSANFRRAWSDPKPRKDSDSDFVNYVLHPLMGSETYLRAREGDFGIAGSIGFSMAASFTWEYLIESWTEHPSRQDLLVTTGVGWLLGEFRYIVKEESTRSGRSTFWIDPIWWTLEYLDFTISRDNGRTFPVLSFSMPL